MQHSLCNRSHRRAATEAGRDRGECGIMTIATIVCLTAQLCVNPANLATVVACGADRTCITVTSDTTGIPVDLPIAEVLRMLDNGPVAVTFAPEPKS